MNEDKAMKLECLRVAAGQGLGDVALESARAMYAWVGGSEAPTLSTGTPTQPDSHASKVLYPAIEAAMKELDELPATFNFTVNRAFNILHAAFWSECPAPASAAPLRANVGQQ